MTVKECEEAVKRPGKFQGEARYVPYYWDCYLMGMADSDDGKVISMTVIQEDKVLFPELKRRKVVKLIETDQGFVEEVR
jgi:hypothetical protein